MTTLKRTSIRSATMVIAAFGTMSVGQTWASSGCAYGAHGNYEAKIQLIENADILADTQSAPDPRWLALIKRRELEAKNQSGIVVVPN